MDYVGVPIIVIISYIVGEIYKIAFTGDIFINMKDMIPKQAEYNRYAPILMTSVDFDSDPVGLYYTVYG